MSEVSYFELLLVIVSVILVLALVAKRYGLPPSAAFICGGLFMAIIPGMPDFTLNPDLVLVVFLPPLLMSGAYFTVWASFRANLPGIAHLAVGAVLFSTLVVGVAAHWMVPELPWSACFALGAIIAPPDAVAAKSVLERVHLPERLSTLLEGESLLNDATSMVVFRVAVTAFLTGTFSAIGAVTMFGVLSLGGALLGFGVGWLILMVLRRVKDPVIVICLTLLGPWVAYVLGDRLHISGVIATVTTGLLFGWHQHDIFGASVRVRAEAFWSILTFLLEALIFVMIGLSLRNVFHTGHQMFSSVSQLAAVIFGIIVATLLARFIWAYGAAFIRVVALKSRGHLPDPGEWGQATIIGWSGMRGVVSLAFALSIPENMPGRGFILLTTFTVILVTVIVQGTTLAAIIRWTGISSADDQSMPHLSENEARVKVATAQRLAMEKLALTENGDIHHPRLLEQYRYREAAAQRFFKDPEHLRTDLDEHYTALQKSIMAGRAEVLRLHRSGQIHDRVLRRLEYELDLQQLSAECY